MAWPKILGNILGTAAACEGVHHATGTDHASWAAWGIAISLCVVSNLAGLAQTPPGARER